MNEKSKSWMLAGGAALALAGLWFYYDSQREDEAYLDGNTLALPVVELKSFFDKEKKPEEYEVECKKVAYAFHNYGLCIVRDPRVNEKDNSVFIDMMERYFLGSDGVRDARPEVGHQVGVTPEFTEKPLEKCAQIGAFGPDDKPLTVCPPELDPKWRFFWRIGPQPKKTKFPGLNAEAVVPPEIPEWKMVMDMWGGKMLGALFVVADMTARGFNMKPDAFTSRMEFGPHLLAPTGSDFNKFQKEGTVLAGYHTDLNFMTIHGKSRFPGLSVWSRKGKKLSVKIPDGCLLIQAGNQLEYLTGGHVMAGFHEVVINKATVDTIARKQRDGEALWRVSSTLFGHIQSDQVLEPLAPFDTSSAKEQYPKIYTGELVSKTLKAISLDTTGGTHMSKSP